MKLYGRDQQDPILPQEYRTGQVTEKCGDGRITHSIYNREVVAGEITIKEKQ